MPIDKCAARGELGAFRRYFYKNVTTLKRFPRSFTASYFCSMQCPPEPACPLVQYGQRRSRQFHLSWLPGTLQDRARESGISLPRFAPALQGLQTAARRDGWRKYLEILPHKPA